MEEKCVNVCFAGGGAKGIAYIGVLEYLEESGCFQRIKTFSGTSIGALISLLAVLGYTSKELTRIICKLDIDKIKDIKIKKFFTNFGIDSCVKIVYLLKQFFLKKNINPDVSFKELYDLTGKRLDILATKLVDYSSVIFNYINTPEECVLNCLLHSMRIPFIWGVNKKEVYVDGCFSSNIPIGHLNPNETIGFICRQQKRIDSGYDIEIQIYLRKLVSCLLFRGNTYELDSHISKGYTIIEIELPNFDVLNFNLPTEQILLLIKLGYASIKNKKL